ncbi:hypothetical protein AOZ06_19190 [Kibdelosporangium phytohabitans]|uniref:OmpR/PhoB-type domain-containing protein n=1 Tax=Kibdelosporangium phytohabitans TaxID=860235 RepID=A0A0N9I2Q8_9PSEU|nr:hypothetical protein AOZ06_19190 [Kibdelosporangium phytohabitans]
MDYEFRLLGALEVLADGEPVAINAAKHRVLLASLLVDANRVVPLRTLLARLWGDNQPSGARNTVQNYVLRLRRTLGEAAPIRTRPEGYAIEVAEDAIDLFRFDALTTRARAGIAAGEVNNAFTLLRGALGLWRGEPLSDVPSDVLRSDVVPALLERRLTAIELRLEIDLRLGRHQDVLPELRDLTGAHPLRERFWVQRILALYRAGRQSEALECYRAVSARLADELGVDPCTELRDVHARVLAADPELTADVAAPLEARPGGMPAELTSFVGRGRQLDLVTRLLTGHRLVTLTGVGGVGKTRLATRIAARQSFPDGVWLACLRGLTDPGTLDRCVADALGVEDHSARARRDVMVEYLRDKALLLVVDNCEHVAAPVADLITTLLRAAPGLRVLATSRQQLGVPGEHLVALPPLAGDEAVRLFADRAAASVQGFRVTPVNEQVVNQLCQRLDGLPLAIELAAARLSSLSIKDIIDRLDDRFRLLARPGKQATLRGVLDWSHTLCSPPERLLWARVSVFTGGFDLVAAESVCAGGEIDRADIMDLLAGLVGKSIVTAATDHERTRYSMMETLREYGAGKLDELGATERLRQAHRAFYQCLVRHGVTHNWCSPRELEWQHLMREQLPNIRTALDSGAGTAEALEMATNLSRCCFFIGNPNEGRYWLSQALAATADPSPQRADATALLTWIATMQGDQQAADELIAVCRMHNPTPTTMFAEGIYVMLVKADPSAIALLGRARRDMAETGDVYMATLFWAIANILLADSESAHGASSVCLTEARQQQAPWAYSWAVWCDGLTELRHGDPARAVELIRDALRMQHDFGDRWGPLWAVEALAWACASDGQLTHSARLLGAAHQMRTRVGVKPIGLFGGAHLQTAEALRAALGASFDTEFRAGSAVPDPIGLALGQCPEDLVRVRPHE